MSEIHVVKRDGTREPFDANKINLALVKASEGLPDQIQKVVQVATELQLTLFDGITSEQLDEAVIHTALQNVKDDPDFDKIAARLLLKNIYKNILGDYESDAELKKLQAQRARKDGEPLPVLQPLLDGKSLKGRDMKDLATNPPIIVAHARIAETEAGLAADAGAGETLDGQRLAQVFPPSVAPATIRRTPARPASGARA